MIKYWWIPCECDWYVTGSMIQWPALWNYKKNKRDGVLLWITWFTINDILFLREIKLDIFWCELLVPVNGERTLLLMVNCTSEVLCSSIGANSLNLLVLAQNLLLRPTAHVCLLLSVLGWNRSVHHTIRWFLVSAASSSRSNWTYSFFLSIAFKIP